MDAKRNPNPTYKKLFGEYLLKKYSVYDLDAIIITDDPAMNFIKEYRADLFASVPIVFAGINRVTPEILNTKNMTGVFENRDLVQTVIDIKAFTEQDELIVVTDPSSTGEANRIKLSKAKDNPIFSIGVVTLDHGSVGGHELNGQNHAKRATGLLLQILDGTPVDDVAPLTKAKSQWYFNWQNVKQHRLEKNKFPAQSQFIHLDQSFYEQNSVLVHSLK